MALANRTHSNHLFNIADASRVGSHEPAVGLARTSVPHRPHWAVAASTTSGHELLEVWGHTVSRARFTSAHTVQRAPPAS
jgi:hypothetical protein